MGKIYLKMLHLSIALLSCPLRGSGVIDLTNQHHQIPSSKVQQLESAQGLEGYRDLLKTLFDYIGCDKTNQAIDLIYQNPLPLDVPDKEGRLPIHWACRRGNQYLFRVLITKNPGQKSIRGLKGLTPLYCAALSGNIDIIQSLLDLGVSLDEKIDNGSTAFHAVCATGKIGAAEFILGKKPEMLNQKRNDGKTPLHAATENKQKLMIEFLMKRLDINLILRDKDLWEKIETILSEETPISIPLKNS